MTYQREFMEHKNFNRPTTSNDTEDIKEEPKERQSPRLLNSEFYHDLKNEQLF